MQPLVTRVYDIKVAGYDDSIQKVGALTKAFQKMDSVKRNLNVQLGKKTAIGDTVSVEKLTQKINELEAQMKKLGRERDASTKEALMLAKADTEAAKASSIRTKSLIDQERELDRLIEKEAKQERALKRQQQEANATAGTYYALLRAQKSALEVYRTTPNDSPLFKKAQADAVAAKRAVDDFNRSLSPDGTLVGEYKTGILNALKQYGLGDVLKGQRTDIKAELDKVIAKNKELAAEYRKAQKAGGDAFNEVDRSLKEGIALAQKMEDQLHGINTTLAGTGSIGKQVTDSIASGFKGLKGQATQLVAGYLGFQAAIGYMGDLKKEASELSDTITELEVNTGNAEGGMRSFVDQLRGIDTRTTVNGLTQISDVALKAGVSNENLFGVTRAIDKVKIAFGKDFGSIETGTETFAKLIGIFYKDGQITEERILGIGNSVRTLANETTASVPFLTDFSGRMAGLKQISNVTLPDILGLGAGFEEFKQSSEVASTALVKVVPKLAGETEKFAKLLGITKKQFSELLNSNPAEALLQVTEKLVKNGKGIEDVAQAFADSELGAGRITTILATLGGKADVFRERIARAKTTIGETSAITDAFNRKNNNLAATLDKLVKRFTDVASGKTFQYTLLAIGTVLSYLLNILPYLITAFTVYRTRLAFAAFAQGTLNEKSLAFYLISKLKAAQMLLVNGYQAVQNFLMSAYIALVIRANTATGVAAVVMRGLGIAIRFATGPIGIIIGLVGALTTVVGIFSARASSAGDATDKLRQKQEKLRREAELNNEIQQKAAEIMGDQENKIRSLTGIVNDGNLSFDTRKKALEQLIAINPSFRDALQGEAIDMNTVNRVTNETIASLQRLANAKARAAVFTQKSQDLATAEVDNSIKTAKAGKQIKEEGSFRQMLRFFTGTNDKVTDAIESDQTVKETKTDIEILNEQRQKRLIELDRVIRINKDAVEAAKKINLENSGEALQSARELKEAIEERFILFGISEETPITPTDPVNLKDPKKPKKEREKKQKNAVEKLKEAYDLEKKQLEAQFNDRLITEEQYLRRLALTEDIYRNVRLKNTKAGNDEEKKQKREFDAELAKDQADSRKKLFDAAKDDAEKQLALYTATAQKELDVATEKAGNNEAAKLAAQVKFNERQQEAQRDFNAQMTILETAFGQKSEKNEKDRQDRLTALQDEGAKLRLQLARANFERALSLIEQAEIEAKNRNEAELLITKLELLRNKSLTAKQREQQIEAAINRQRRADTQTEIDSIKKLLLVYNLRFGVLAVTNKEYRELLLQLKRLQVQQAEEAGGLSTIIQPKAPGKGSLAQMIKDRARGKFTLGKDKEGKAIDGSEVLGDFLAQGYDLALESMNRYFDAELRRVEQSKQAALSRIELDREQRLAQAQSAAERESIERQAEAQRRQAEKKAGEESKKIRRSQAKLALATELGNIWASVWELGPIAAPIVGTAFSALALARYFGNIKDINAQQFAGGGRVRKFSDGGGVITGPANIQPMANGDNVLATVRTGEVILNARQQRALGGPSTFARIGVPGFANGGFTGLGNFRLGENLRPPMDINTYIGTSGGAVSMDAIKEVANATAMAGAAIVATNRKIEDLKVYVVAREVSDANKKTDIASSAGTL